MRKISETQTGMLKKCCDTPWEMLQEPVQVAPHVFYVSGIKWVASYLLDTSKGLILIDTGMENTLFLLLESIRKIGRDPANIKCILISHAHYDHCGAACLLQKYTGAKLMMSRDDLPNLHEKSELLLSGGYHFSAFIPDEFFSDSKPIVLGRFVIRTVSTPGHTPGCVSFFFDDEEESTHHIFHCAMHGGMGMNTLTDLYLTENNESTECRSCYRKSMLKVMNEQVDIILPSHPTSSEPIKQFTDRNMISETDRTRWGDLCRERLMMLDDLEQSSNL